MLAANRYQGHLYSMPISADASVLWYRRDWLAADGNLIADGRVVLDGPQSRRAIAFLRAPVHEHHLASPDVVD